MIRFRIDGRTIKSGALKSNRLSKCHQVRKYIAYALDLLTWCDASENPLKSICENANSLAHILTHIGLSTFEKELIDAFL